MNTPYEITTPYLSHVENELKGAIVERFWSTQMLNAAQGEQGRVVLAGKYNSEDYWLSQDVVTDLKSELAKLDRVIRKCKEVLGV